MNYDTNKRNFLPSYRLAPFAKHLRGAESQAHFRFKNGGERYENSNIQKTNKTGLKLISTAVKEKGQIRQKGHTQKRRKGQHTERIDTWSNVAKQMYNHRLPFGNN